MKKRKDIATVIAVSIAIISVVLAVYVTGTKNSGPQAPEALSPGEMAMRQAKGMGAYFTLDEQEQENVFRLYKAYEDVRIPYGEKIRKAENGGVPVTLEDTRQFANAITVAKLELETGVKAILTEAEYEQWRKKERRAQITYK